MIVAINYADTKFRDAQKYNSKTAKKIGHVDKVVEYSPNSIDEDFKNRNKELFIEGDPQIGKYGIWRPIITYDAFNQIKVGDYLIYRDSGTYYINTVRYLIDFMDKKKLEVLVFELPFIEKYWTKRDVFYRLEADKEKYTDSNQRLSTIFILKNLTTCKPYGIMSSDKRKAPRDSGDCFWELPTQIS